MSSTRKGSRALARRLPLMVAIAALAALIAAASSASQTGATSPNFSAAVLTPDSTYTGDKSLSGRLARTDQSLLNLKSSKPVILNLQGTDTDLSKRLIDFASGLTYALDGGMQRIADKVFLLTPRNVEVSAEERARLIAKGFFMRQARSV